jgi:ribonuclease HI
MFILSQKLKILKDKLKFWNKNCFGDVHELVTTAETNLQQIQHQIQSNGPTDLLLNDEIEAHKNLEDALNKQECFWQEKAHLNWHLEGDRNTKYFHRLAKIKTTTKAITSLQDGEHVLTDQNQISEHIVNYYKNLFSTNIVLQEQLLADEVIPNLITNEVNSLLTALPSHQEIKAAVFALNKDSAPGPDGFSAYFYQYFWDIVHVDVSNAVLEFFTSGWILPGFNSNIIALLPKSENASTIDQFRPIAMANFKFKIISKIIADRLASILPSLISEEQRGFVHDRNIKDCLCIASEATNLLHNKAFGGNLALKIDISKAFDTLEWPFLLNVLRKFGFNEVFCNWILVILQSAFLSVSINGKSHGYFACSRGVRQGDPLSPLLFCIAEDVLSRSISKLVAEGKLDLIKGTRNCMVPSHTFYADDLMIFCKGKLDGLRALKDLFESYALESGQKINNAKSTIYSGSTTPGRLNLIVQLLNFKIGSIPYNYLGVPIFRGKPKASFLQPVADKIKLKLSAWKASLLSIAGRVQLVKAIIQSMMIYSITLYSWPVSLIKDVERNIRNFIWSGDPEKRKLVTVSWKKICRPLEQGGLNIRSISSLNKASNLKLCWSILTSNCSWAKLLKDRVVRGRKIIQHHIHSSIWSSVKDEFSTILENSFWLLGNGKDINFWNDNWCGCSLADLFNIPPHISQNLLSTVSDYINNGAWHFPNQLLQHYNFGFLIQRTTIPFADSQDQLIWIHTDSGNLQLKDAYSFKLPQFQDLPWAKLIWSSDIPPSKSLFVWRLMNAKIPTDENLLARGCYLPSMCNFCCKQAETSYHIFFECGFAKHLWSWLANCLDLSLRFSSIEDIWNICELNWSPQCKVTITAAIINLLNTIWSVRNQARFDDKRVNVQSAISMIISCTSLSGNNTKKVASNSLRDFSVLKKFNVVIHPSRLKTVKEIFWIPTLGNCVKCNIDGASKGNPGAASCGGIFRNCNSDFLLCFAEPLGFVSSFIAELNGALMAIEVASQMNWLNLWLETDSELVVSAFKDPNRLVTWSLRNRWNNALGLIRHMNFVISHTFREGNAVADRLANHGLTLNSVMFWQAPPEFIKEDLSRNKLGLSNFRVVSC